MSLLLHVDYETTSEESSNVLLDSLKVVAAHQVSANFKNVLTYHFSRPNPIDNPTKIEFTECYGDEACFWNHGAAPHLGPHFMNLYNDKYRLKQHTYALADWTGRDQIKGLLVQILNATFPAFSGYLINPKFSSAEAGHASIMIKMKFYADKTEEEEQEKKVAAACIDTVNPLTNVVFKRDDCILAMQTFTSLQACCDYFKEKKDSLSKVVKDLHAKLEVYGEISEELKEIFNKLPFENKNFLKTEVGYEIHPQASLQ